MAEGFSSFTKTFLTSVKDDDKVGLEVMDNIGKEEQNLTNLSTPSKRLSSEEHLS
jgi:hypothetical protein